MSNSNKKKCDIEQFAEAFMAALLADNEIGPLINTLIWLQKESKVCK